MTQPHALRIISVRIGCGSSLAGATRPLWLPIFGYKYTMEAPKKRGRKPLIITLKSISSRLGDLSYDDRVAVSEFIDRLLATPSPPPSPSTGIPIYVAGGESEC